MLGEDKEPLNMKKVVIIVADCAVYLWIAMVLSIGAGEILELFP